MLSKILEDKKLGSESKILDIGAGVGWTTVLLAARTGAYATAIDSNHYTNTRSIKSDLLDMFFRNLSVLRREPEFNAIMTRADIAEVIDRCFFINMSAMDMHFEDNTFDFVFSLNAFEHIPDPAIAIKELHRVLKPGGEGYIQFHPLYYSDDGSHLHACALLDKPWVHLLYDRDQIRKMIIEAGKVPNEIDNILDSLNGWSARQFHDLFSKSGLRIINKNVYKGFTIQGSEKSDQFLMLKKQFPEEELTTIGMTLHLMKRQI
jgi:ubiquinone/menaquinone biosynthesis C-methylase UbiE